ncbi:PREDICTED: proline-rich transmembrane protein 1-like [Cyprinodon variegatus]|uniref:proline-rich transmembrane protein 1-like n=1 Tax=Cyprinodon variegatus TaxID=28743 RepID=UPI0007428466|nr:PREDICTED: proline-rich transmembrane protein 1-like [Cyprinodon variegatus]
MLPSSPPPPYQEPSYPVPLYSAQPQGYGFDQELYRLPFQQPGQQPYFNGHEQSGEPTVFTVQPPAYIHQAGPVKDYLGFSIFTTLCCCLPLGLAACASSIATRNANALGERFTAHRISNQAWKLNLVALGFGTLIWASVFIVLVIALYL